MILVRHGDAGDKSRWRRPDDRRPLSGLGRRQSAELVRTLTGDAVDAVWSSPALRCRQTVQPLGGARGLQVRTAPLLGKDAGGDALLDWLRDNDTRGWVLCTHGEVFEALFAAAARAGLVGGERQVTAKGGFWRIPGVDSAADYVVPNPAR